MMWNFLYHSWTKDWRSAWSYMLFTCMMSKYRNSFGKVKLSLLSFSMIQAYIWVLWNHFKSHLSRERRSSSLKQYWGFWYVAQLKLQHPPSPILFKYNSIPLGDGGGRLCSLRESGRKTTLSFRNGCLLAQTVGVVNMRSHWHTREDLSTPRTNHFFWNQFYICIYIVLYHTIHVPI